MNFRWVTCFIINPLFQDWKALPTQKLHWAQKAYWFCVGEKHSVTSILCFVIFPCRHLNCELILFRINVENLEKRQWEHKTKLKLIACESFFLLFFGSIFGKIFVFHFQETSKQKFLENSSAKIKSSIKIEDNLNQFIDIVYWYKSRFLRCKSFLSMWNLLHFILFDSWTR